MKLSVIIKTANLLTLFFIFGNRELTAQENVDSVIFKTILLKNNKLKSAPYNPSDRMSEFKKGDSVKVYSYSQDYYFVEVNGEKGYLLSGSYFRESASLKEFKNKINLIERDSSTVFKKRRDDYLTQREIEAKTKCQYRTNRIDPINGKSLKTTEDYKIGKVHSYNLSIVLSAVNNSKYIHFYLEVDLGCSSPYRSSRSKVEIKLKNDDLLTFYHSGDINCGDDFYLMGKLSSSEANRLKKSKIEMVRLTGTEGHQDITDINYNDIFIDKIKCIE